MVSLNSLVANYAVKFTPEADVDPVVSFESFGS